MKKIAIVAVTSFTSGAFAIHVIDSIVLKKAQERMKERLENTILIKP